MSKPIPKVPAFDRLKVLPKMVKNPIPHLLHWHEEFGEIYRLSLGSRPVVVINKPELIQQVLQKKNRSFEKSIVQTGVLKRYIGQGLLTSTGDYWLRQRRSIQPGFHKRRLAQVSHLIVTEINRFSQQLEDKAKAGKAVDINSLMMKVTSQIIGKSLFSDSQTDEDLAHIEEVITIIQNHMIKVVRIPFAQQYYELIGRNEKYEKLAKDSDSLISKVIRERLRTKEQKDDLLDMLLDVRYEDTGEGMTVEQLRDEALILYVAGHETTANAMTWLWYLLDKHPKVVEKLQEEAKRVLNGANPTFEDVRQLVYTKQVIQESMRLYPPAWTMDRVAVEDVQLGDYMIKKGKIIIPFIYAAHHSTAYWEQPEAFLPERFSKEKEKQIPAFAYFPFGGGPRLCIGYQFAMMEMQFLVAMLITRFQFSLAQTHEPELQPMVTLRPRGGLMMKVNDIK